MRPKIDNLPKHIGIIMDGNGRWAKKRFLPVATGHTRGAKRVTELLDVSIYYNIKVVTLYAFSTENWKRDQKEINHLMKIIHKFYENDFFTILKNNVKIKFIGSDKKIPSETLKIIKTMEDKSLNNTGIELNIAFNYGGQEELVMAVNKSLQNKRVDQQNLSETNLMITAEDIENNLYTARQPNVDLLIRTSGEQRLSNFLLWQSAYAEFIFPEVLWPDFKEKNFIECLLEFSKRNRRFGGR